MGLSGEAKKEFLDDKLFTCDFCLPDQEITFKAESALNRHTMRFHTKKALKRRALSAYPIPRVEMGPKKPVTNFAMGDKVFNNNNANIMETIQNLQEHLGLATKSFITLSAKDQAEVGSRLKELLHTVTDGSFLPLMNYCLEECHVRKLCALKGIRTDELPSSSLQLKEEDVKKEEPKEEPKEPTEEPTDSDVDERMAEADADIEAEFWNTGDENHGYSREKQPGNHFANIIPSQYDDCDPARVFLGNLPHDTRERDIEKFFAKYGRVYNIFINKNVRLLESIRKNGKYGFCEFDDYRDADDAVHDLNSRELLGERITVEHARGPRRRKEGVRRSWIDKYYGPPTTSNYRVIVENLSSRVSWQDLKDLMREVSYADAHRPWRNEGVVEFATKSDMMRAVEKYDDYTLEGRRLKLIIDNGWSMSRSTSTSRFWSRSSSSSRSRSRSSDCSRSRDRSKSQDRRQRSAEKNRSRSRERSGSKDISRSHTTEKADEKGRSRSRTRSRSRSKDDRDRRDENNHENRSGKPWWYPTSASKGTEELLRN